MIWVIVYFLFSLLIIFVVFIHKQLPKIRWLRNLALWLLFKEDNLIIFIKSRLKKIRY